MPRPWEYLPQSDDWRASQRSLARRFFHAIRPPIGGLRGIWNDLDSEPLGRRIPGTIPVALIALLVGTIASVVCIAAKINMDYADAMSHLTIARRILDNKSPGFQQLGTVWLPAAGGADVAGAVGAVVGAPEVASGNGFRESLSLSPASWELRTKAPATSTATPSADAGMSQRERALRPAVRAWIFMSPSPSGRIASAWEARI